ncbi:MAG: TonB C-terminal domain-containing protein [Burkholderiales bacterium]|jgi:colicin import membrane protein|nr:TonB C-terminal domain-containing protein [Burkholderiales bacterium]
MAAVVAEQRPQQPRSEQNTPAAFLLALAMHTLLVAALWISVQWNVEPAGAVVVELWGGAPSAGPAAAPEPVVIAPPPPPTPPKAEPEPEKPDADIVVKQEKKPPPKVEPPDPKRIEAEKRRIEAERLRAEAETRRREAEKKQLEAERKKQAEAMAQAAERRREEERREAVRKAEEARMLAQAGAGGSAGGSSAGSPGGRPGGTAAAGTGGGDATYAGQLNALIRPRIIFAVPENTPASIHAEFQVDLLPTGEILAVKKLKSSGLPGYDEAVERAIRRTDPFPRKRDGTVERTVIIRFRPVDAQ